MPPAVNYTGFCLPNIIFHSHRDMLEVKAIPGRGFGTVAARPINAGEMVLTELPIMLYPQQSMCASSCSFCLRMLAPTGKPLASRHSLPLSARLRPAAVAVAALHLT